jgi:hypothetical protein
MLHVGERGEVHTGFWWGNLKEIGHLDLKTSGIAGYVWTGLILLRIGTGGGLL